ncbi:MAG: 2'-5' RNA ligase family protein [Candidatus Nomurabacteria bacterium]|jgi:2'-5' RNA ligase|nr:2'-5' RNA ligase family protein [Candidatus Nomurabacteria bacterium]
MPSREQAKFFIGHVPKFADLEPELSRVGDKFERGLIEHATITPPFEQKYDTETRQVIQRICRFIAPFETKTIGAGLFGPNENIVAQKIQIVPELLAFHSLCIAAFKHQHPKAELDLGWALENYRPHITFRQIDSSGLIGRVDNLPIKIDGVTVFEKSGSAPYEIVDEMRFEGKMYEIGEKVGE